MTLIYCSKNYMHMCVLIIIHNTNTFFPWSFVYFFLHHSFSLLVLHPIPATHYYIHIHLNATDILIDHSHRLKWLENLPISCTVAFTLGLKTCMTTCIFFTTNLPKTSDIAWTCDLTAASHDLTKTFPGVHVCYSAEWTVFPGEVL